MRALAALLLAAVPGWKGAAAEPRGGAEIMVYAAASLREALQRLSPMCEKGSGARLVFNFGASNDLARQIEAAGKADLFFSADESLMDRLSQAGLVQETSRRSVLSNRLVVIGPADSILSIRSAADLAGRAVRHLSLANPEAVPAGKYARAWLEKAGQWGAVKDRVVPAVDVRAALAAVESGLMDAGIVYATDAALSRKVRILLEVPVEDGPPISYPLAILRNRPQPERARKVASCLQGPEARAAYVALGFTVKSEAP